MGGLGLQSHGLRSALYFRCGSPALDKFYQVVSEALVYVNEPISRRLASDAKDCAQEVGEFEFSPHTCIPIDVNSFSGREFDASPVASGRIGWEFGGAGASFSHGGTISRVRVLGQVGDLKRRGFCVQSVQSRCWSCEETSSAAPFLMCASCQAIQPLDKDVDYFQLLSVERSYVQDPKLLERKYKQLQKFLHPDLSSRKSQREQVYASDQSAQVIKAYYTLLDPLSRAQYMLRLSGVDVDEEGTIHDSALLMEIMELREEVEEATDPEKLVNIKEQNKKKMSECENGLKEVFQSGDITHAVPLVQRMTYYHKVIEEITRKQ